MASGKTVVSASHVYGDGNLGDVATLLERRVYLGVDTSTANSLDVTPYLTNYEYRVIQTGIASDYNTTTLANDWFVGTLNAPFLESHYLFNCYNPDVSTIEGESVFAVGYPDDYAMKMKKTNGTVLAYESQWSQLKTTANVKVGMSGGPLVAILGGRSAIGIICGTRTIAGYDYSYSTLITDDIVDIICDRIINY